MNFFYFLYSRFLLVTYFIHISVYMSIPIPQFIPPRPTAFPPWFGFVVVKFTSLLYFSDAEGEVLVIKPQEASGSVPHPHRDCFNSGPQRLSPLRLKTRGISSRADSPDHRGWVGLRLAGLSPPPCVPTTYHSLSL